MKKSFFSFSMAVLILFVAAVGLCLQTLNDAQAVSAFGSGMRIVLDAGHGGVDGGVSGVKTGVKESDLNLSITLFLRDVLSDMGFDVTLTRKTEAGLYGTATKGFKRRDMERRKEIIGKARPDLVISVHQNRYPSQSTRGGQVFYKKEDEKSGKIAKSVQEKLNTLYGEQGARPRNSMPAEYFILECSPYPSVIVECGFLSNAQDEALLTTEGWQKRLAESVASGVVAYLAAVA